LKQVSIVRINTYNKERLMNDGKDIGLDVQHAYSTTA